MKKTIIPAILALALGGLALGSLSGRAVKVSADEVDDTPNFDEDFESYTINGDVREELGVKWTNSWYKNLGDGDAIAGSADKFHVAASPTDESNKVLYVDTLTANESFYFLTMKDLRVKDFRLSYDFYQTKSTNAPWAGFNFRKPVDGRYNGVTNVMMVMRCWGDTGFSPQMYRSVDSSFTVLEDFGLDGGPALNWDSSRGEAFEGAAETWLHITLEVIGNDFKYYVNDVLLGQVTITKKTANNYGYVSLISCVDQAYFDNIHLENLDEYPEGGGGGEEGGAQAPTMVRTDYTVNLGEDLTVECDLHGELLTELRQAANPILPQYYELDGTRITISKDYLQTLGVGRWNFIIATAGGTVGFRVSIVDPSAQPDDPVTPTPDPKEDDKKKGCGGAIIGTAIASAIALTGVVVIASKKKRK